MTTTRLFPVDKVRKFFDILSRLSGGIPIDTLHYPWKDYQTIYTKNSEHVPCTREVFVHRTINKWLKGKYLVIYRRSDLGVQYKQYISITHLVYANNWGTGYIRVGMIDYSNPYKSDLFFSSEQFDFNKCLYLEGEWAEDTSKHLQLLSLISMDDVPEKEYTFKAYDWSKYPKRVKKGTDPIEIISTTISFKAKTEMEAHKKKRNYETQSKETKEQIIIGELIEIKEVV